MSADHPVAVVTGAARGGGRGVALALAGHMGTVALVGRSTEEHPNRLLPGTLEPTRDELAALGTEAVCFAGLERFTTGLATELAGTGVSVNCVRVDEALRSEALASLIGDPSVYDDREGARPEEFGGAVRWITQQPPSFSGNVLTFQQLRDLGALVRPEKAT